MNRFTKTFVSLLTVFVFVFASTGLAFAGNTGFEEYDPITSASSDDVVVDDDDDSSANPANDGEEEGEVETPDPEPEAPAFAAPIMSLAAFSEAARYFPWTIRPTR